MRSAGGRTGAVGVPRLRRGRPRPCGWAVDGLDALVDGAAACAINAIISGAYTVHICATIPGTDAQGHLHGFLREEQRAPPITLCLAILYTSSRKRASNPDRNVTSLLTLATRPLAPPDPIRLVFLTSTLRFAVISASHFARVSHILRLCVNGSAAVAAVLPFPATPPLPATAFVQLA